MDCQAAARAVKELLPRLQGGRVLITSRLSQWSAGVAALPLGVLAPEAAADYLLAATAPERRQTPDDAADARVLADELGHLALALEQAGAYINHLGQSFADYLKTWRDKRDQVLKWHDAALMNYPLSVATTWETSFEQLGAPARRLLRRLAWLGNEPIPEALLDVPVPGAEDEAGDPRLALAELRRYSLITRAQDAPGFSLHKLVREVTRADQRDEPVPAALVEALNWINAAFVGDPQDVRSWPVLDPLAPHTLTVVGYADDAGIANPTSRMMNSIGVLLKTKALHDEAEPLIRRALAIDETTFGTDNPRVASHLNNLAQLLRATNRLTEAEPLMRQALTIDESSLGPDHPDVATDLNNLGLLLMETDRLDEAEPLMRRALAIDETSLGAGHPGVATDLSNLAILLKATDRLAEAEPLLLRARAIDEASFGADHPDVAIDLNNLAQVLKDTQRLAEAEPLMRRALSIFMGSLGMEHPNTQTARDNYLALLHAMGRTEAEIDSALASLSGEADE